MNPWQPLISLPLQPDIEGGETLLFAGDFYLGANRGSLGASDLVDDQVRALIDSSTLSVVNLEAPCREGSRLPKSGPALRQHTGAPGILRDCGFDAVTLANNHVMDYGWTALDATMSACRDTGLAMCGAGPSASESAAPWFWRAPSGWTLALFSFCEREFGISGPSSPGAAWLAPPGSGFPDPEQAIAEARKEADLVILCVHGGVEGIPIPPPERRRRLRSLAEAGAGVVIGHHVHVPQAWEVWNGSLIFYSLGDFYMDEVWGGRYPARDWSILPRIRVVDGKVTGATVHGFERVADRIEPLGRLRSPERARQYLIELGGSTTGPDFGALWQEAAFQQLPFYIQEFAGALPVVETWASTFRGRVRQSLQTVRNVARLWSGADTSPPLAPRAALTWLNIMRCESHREMVETALAVHGKEQPDGRTADSARRWAALRSEMSLLSPAG